MKNLIVALLLCSTLTTFAQKSNFSGNWTLDKNKTDFHGAPEWVLPRYLKVEQQADKLTLTRTAVNEDMEEQMPVTETLSFDSTPSIRKSDSGPEVTTTLKWTNDMSFTLIRKGAQEATEDWWLEDGGKTLVLNRKVR